jgi:hypothetical protein
MVPDFSRGVAKGAIEPGLYRQSKSEADTQFLSIVPLGRIRFIEGGPPSFRCPYFAALIF